MCLPAGYPAGFFIGIRIVWRDQISNRASRGDQTDPTTSAMLV